MLTQQDLNKLVKKLAIKFLLKDELHQMKADLFNKLDLILKEILISRKERTIINRRISEHEDRITHLEAALPN